MNLAQSTVTIDAIEPNLTDKAINDWLEPHYVALDSSVPARNKLFLFLCGSYGESERQQLIIQQAAKMGYHAINLRYPNSTPINSLCRLSRDPDCHEQIRRAIIYGNTEADDLEINITCANSIQNRLTKLLIYLYEQNPAAGWLNYLEGLRLRWESIVVSGHSQGGGHAALIAQEELVSRVIMLSAPLDFSKAFRAPATWLGKDSATPKDRYYGFAHAEDPGIRKILRAWKLLGLGENMVNVDEETPPYNHSHQLFTTFPIANPRKRHGSLVVDALTPKLQDGTPVFQKVWQYLLQD